MTLWNDIITGICLLLLVLLLWKELRRENRSRLAARMTASALAVIGLACMALPLSYQRHKDERLSGREGILLTEGYDPDSLRQFLQAAWQQGTGNFSKGKMNVFSAVDGLPVIDESPGLTRLHVFGYGLTREEWDSLHPPALTFHPSAIRAGIVSVDWKRKLSPGEKLRVQASLSPAVGKPVKIILMGMGSPLDSVIMAAGPGGDIPAAGPMPKETDFELSTIPAQNGRSVYHLLVLSGTDTLEQEPLPVEVLSGKKLRILLLAASPDFENTFLVNWLSRNGHAVATRTAISKGKYNEAALNMPRTGLDLITPSLLDKFDIVIADAADLQAESAVEISNLRRQIAEKGLGLIIKADSMVNLFSMETVRDNSQRLYIKERPGIRSLLRDSLSRTVVSSGIYGSGKLVFTTVNTTYYQMLSGDKKEYATYWSSILQEAVREDGPGEEWQLAPALPRVNEPVEVRLQTNKSGLPQGQFDNAAVYLAGSPLLPFLWQGTYWPVSAGWQSCATLQGDTCQWYAWPAGSWRNIYRNQRWKETEEYITEQAHDTTVAGRGAKTASTKISLLEGQPASEQSADEQSAGGERVLLAKGWFYTLFLLSCLFLWIERKW